MISELDTLTELAVDRWFLFALAIALATLFVSWAARSNFGWMGAGALLLGVTGSTFIVGVFEPLPLVASAGLALVTGLLARPVLAEVAILTIAFVLADVSWRPQISWPVWIGAAVAVVAAWGPRRFERADPRVLGIVIGGAAAAVWASVPDTEIPRALLGATLAVSLASVFGGKKLLVGPAVGAFVGLATFATLYGGSARAVSVFGAWTGMFLLALIGVKRFDRTPVWAWTVAQLIMVVAGSRVIAVAGSGTAALGVAAVAAAVSSALLAVAADRGVAPSNGHTRAI